MLFETLGLHVEACKQKSDCYESYSGLKPVIQKILNRTNISTSRQPLVFVYCKRLLHSC